MKTLVKALATCFGLGLSPVLPGTVASAAATLLFVFALRGLDGVLYAALVVALFFVGVAVSKAAADACGRPDPGHVVIDEVCGQLIALAYLPPGWVPAGLAFALFRVFDIIKPWPIRRLERLPGGWGIMADDVGAGLAAAILTRLALLVV
jgi:phosphatidylglycerophosphatase A